MRHCIGYPRGSCQTLIEASRRLCRFCTRTEVLENHGPTCSECSRPAVARGLCTTHHAAWLSHRDELPEPPLRRSFSDPRAVQNMRGPRHVLDVREVVELRRRRFEGWRIEHLAAAYGVSTRTVWRYLTGQRDADRSVRA